VRVKLEGFEKKKEHKKNFEILGLKSKKFKN
jgi:hypothetical protein